MPANQQLIEIDHISEENAPAIYVQDGLKPFLQMIRDEVCGEVPDLTTKKGRDRIASLAATVSKRKVAVEKPGRDYLRRIKELPRVIEVELGQFVKEANALRDEIRKPLTDWEDAEAAKKKEIETWVAGLRLDATVIDSSTAEDLRLHIGAFEEIAIDGEWLGDYEAEAHRLKGATITSLKQALVKREEYEAQQAELARHRAEAAAREQREREERIAREVAERAQREAEQKAQAEREAAIRREQEAKAAAERRELELKLQAEQAERAAAQAEANRVAAEQRAAQERESAARRAEEAAEQARLAEQRRQHEEAAEAQRQQKAREADKAYKGSINRTALEAFIAGGMPEACAKQAVTLIAQRKIPNITIAY